MTLIKLPSSSECRIFISCAEKLMPRRGMDTNRDIEAKADKGGVSAAAAAGEPEAKRPKKGKIFNVRLGGD